MRAFPVQLSGSIMNDLMKNRLLLVLVLLMASLVVSAGSAVAGDPNGLCVCIEINGHCYTIGGC